jgi:3-oxoacyl-[acyl-carrier protein] reductase
VEQSEVSEVPDTSGRIAVVTGAASGIGRRVAQRLSERGVTVEGWDLVACDLPHSTRVDVGDESSVAVAAADLQRRRKGVHILVCSAGILGPAVPVESCSLSDWNRVLRVNLTGLFLTCRALVPLMRVAGWGRIVILASIAGKEGSPNMAPYSASKGGAIAFTKALGKELAGTGILVNCIAPSPIDTPMVRGFDRRMLEGMVAKSPLGRLAKVDEAAELALWLCSEACSFNTGAVFDLSGGRATY